jgi:hypothetical protein
VHVILFDDLKTAASRVYRDTLRFLDLPHDGRTDFPVRNAFQQPRAGLMRDSVMWLAAARNRLPIRKGLGIMRGLTQLTSKPGARAPLPADFHGELADYFRNDVALLAELLGGDFSRWLAVPRCESAAEGGDNHEARAATALA